MNITLTDIRGCSLSVDVDHIVDVVLQPLTHATYVYIKPAGTKTLKVSETPWQVAELIAKAQHAAVLEDVASLEHKVVMLEGRLRRAQATQFGLIPEDIANKIPTVMRAQAAFLERVGRKPSVSELADGVNLSTRVVQKVLDHMEADLRPSVTPVTPVPQPPQCYGRPDLRDAESKRCSACLYLRICGVIVRRKKEADGAAKVMTERQAENDMIRRTGICPKCSGLLAISDTRVDNSSGWVDYRCVRSRQCGFSREVFVTDEPAATIAAESTDADASIAAKQVLNRARFFVRGFRMAESRDPTVAELSDGLAVSAVVAKECLRMLAAINTLSPEKKP